MIRFIKNNIKDCKKYALQLSILILIFSFAISFFIGVYSVCNQDMKLFYSISNKVNLNDILIKPSNSSDLDNLPSALYNNGDGGDFDPYFSKFSDYFINNWAKNYSKKFYSKRKLYSNYTFWSNYEDTFNDIQLQTSSKNYNYKQLKIFSEANNYSTDAVSKDFPTNHPLLRTYEETGNKYYPIYVDKNWAKSSNLKINDTFSINNIVFKIVDFFNTTLLANNPSDVSLFSGKSKESPLFIMNWKDAWKIRNDLSLIRPDPKFFYSVRFPNIKETFSKRGGYINTYINEFNSFISWVEKNKIVILKDESKYKISLKVYSWADKHYRFSSYSSSFLLSIFVYKILSIFISILLLLFDFILIMIFARSLINIDRPRHGVLKSLGYTTKEISLMWLGLSFVFSSISFFISIFLSTGIYFEFYKIVNSSFMLQTNKTYFFVWLLIASVAILFFIMVSSLILYTISALKTRAVLLLSQKREISVNFFNRNIIKIIKYLPFNVRFGIINFLSSGFRSVMLFIIIFSIILSLTISFYLGTIPNSTINNYARSYNYQNNYQIGLGTGLLSKYPDSNSPLDNLFKSKNIHPLSVEDDLNNYIPQGKTIKYFDKDHRQTEVNRKSSYFQKADYVINHSGKFSDLNMTIDTNQKQVSFGNSEDSKVLSLYFFTVGYREDSSLMNRFFEKSSIKVIIGTKTYYLFKDNFNSNEKTLISNSLKNWTPVHNNNETAENILNLLLGIKTKIFWLNPESRIMLNTFFYNSSTDDYCRVDTVGDKDKTFQYLDEQDKKQFVYMNSTNKTNSLYRIYQLNDNPGDYSPNTENDKISSIQNISNIFGNVSFNNDIKNNFSPKSIEKYVSKNEVPILISADMAKIYNLKINSYFKYGLFRLLAAEDNSLLYNNILEPIIAKAIIHQFNGGNPFAKYSFKVVGIVPDYFQEDAFVTSTETSIIFQQFYNSLNAETINSLKPLGITFAKNLPTPFFDYANSINYLLSKEPKNYFINSVYSAPEYIFPYSTLYSTTLFLMFSYYYNIKDILRGLRTGFSLLESLLIFFNVILVLVGSMGIIYLNIFFINENKRYIAALKTLGYKNTSIIAMFLTIYIPMIIAAAVFSLLSTIYILHFLLVQTYNRINFMFFYSRDIKYFFFVLITFLILYLIVFFISYRIISKIKPQKVLEI